MVEALIASVGTVVGVLGVPFGTKYVMTALGRSDTSLPLVLTVVAVMALSPSIPEMVGAVGLAYTLNAVAERV